MSGGRRVEEREGEGGGENITASCVKRSTVDGHGRDVASLAEQTDGEMASERLRPGWLAGQLLINHFPSAVVPSNHQSIPSSLPFMQTKDELVVVGGGALFKILTMLPPSLPPFLPSLVLFSSRPLLCPLLVSRGAFSARETG